jgi:hypothetical protein
MQFARTANDWLAMGLTLTPARAKRHLMGSDYAVLLAVEEQDRIYQRLAEQHSGSFAQPRNMQCAGAVCWSAYFHLKLLQHFVESREVMFPYLKGSIGRYASTRVKLEISHVDWLLSVWARASRGYHSDIPEQLPLQLRIVDLATATSHKFQRIMEVIHVIRYTLMNRLELFDWSSADELIEQARCRIRGALFDVSNQVARIEHLAQARWDGTVREAMNERIATVLHILHLVGQWLAMPELATVSAVAKPVPQFVGSLPPVLSPGSKPVTAKPVDRSMLAKVQRFIVEYERMDCIERVKKPSGGALVIGQEPWSPIYLVNDPVYFETQSFMKGDYFALQPQSHTMFTRLSALEVEEMKLAHHLEEPIDHFDFVS